MSVRTHHCGLALAVMGLLATVVALADPAPFDLVGPTLVGTVTRGKVTLPITKVPSFAGGDQLLLKAELPTDQSAQYLMVAAFLRGPTNPPPDNWFFRCKTWTRACTQNGLAITVPKDAQQLLVFFAPATGGDFKTLRSAVQGRPGAFVRAAQQLNQAALDRSRLDRYVAGVRQLEDAGPAALKETAPMLARSLAIKVDEKCLDRIPALQVPCLTQGHESLILNDGHETSMVATLTSGPASDLAMQAGSTAKMESGAYLPYIGSVFDIARLMDSFRTAHYQYIPALASRRDDQMVLLLNTPPSFHEPQSVLVAALPAIESSKEPSLHAIDSSKAYCAYRSPLTLALEGAPLVFATSYAHDMVLNVTGTNGKIVSLPSHPDAKQGGFVVDTSALNTADIDESQAAVLSGYWGFDKFAGPSFRLVKPQAHPWALVPGDEAALVVGREDTIHLQSGNASCITDIRLKGSSGPENSVTWKVIRDDMVELKLPLQTMEPGALTLIVNQYGTAESQQIDLSAFADAGHLDNFTLYSGDTVGVLKGSRLDQVVALQLMGYEFTPGVLSSANGTDELVMTATDSQGVVNLKSGDTAKAKVRLKDGRTFSLIATIGSPRPRGTLIAKNITMAASGNSNTIELSTDDELPLDATLAFSVRTQWPATFTSDETIEVATTDNSSSVALSLSNGAMTLESSKVAVVRLHPASAFGLSTFGALQFRLVARGVAGDWQPLATLVRLPTLSNLLCPSTNSSACTLWGSNLFLLDSIASDATFSEPVQISEGFPGSSLPVPRPVDGRLYLKLRDNPAAINVATFPQAAPVADFGKTPPTQVSRAGDDNIPSAIPGPEGAGSTVKDSEEK